MVLICSREGDSGGPLLKVDAPRGEVGEGAASLDLLMGVISFGSTSCGDGERPGVYTDVGYFREWILEIIEASPSKAAFSEERLSAHVLPGLDTWH